MTDADAPQPTPPSDEGTGTGAGPADGSANGRENSTVDTFGIALPTDWVRFPLESGDFEQFVTGQRRRLESETRLSKTAVRQFELIMRQLRNDCQRESISMVAVMNAVLVDDTAADGTATDGNDADAEAASTGELLSAACTISSMSKASLGTDLPLTVNTIAAAMTREPKDDENGAEIINLDAPAVVDLAVGQAVKLVRLHTYPPDPTTLQRMAVFVQHFLHPIDDGRRAVVVTFASPTPTFSKPLSGLFDQMMTTFRTFSGDEPTDPVG